MTLFMRGDAMIAIHEMQLAEHGGRAGVRDHQALSAIAVAARDWDDIAVSAAIYGAGLVRMQPFEAGNLATGMALAEAFLGSNGRQIEATDSEMFKTWAAVADGSLDETGLADWIRERI